MISMLSIGVGDYSVATAIDASFENLDYAVTDSACIVKTANSTLKIGHLCSLSSEGAGDAQAVRNNIFRSIMELRILRPKGSIVYFAGHGMDVGGKLHICPQDFDPRIPEHSSISVSSLVQLLADQPGWTLFIIDACRSLPALEPRRNRTQRHGGVLVADNVCMLMACSKGQRSYETPSIRGESAGGIFTHFLCKSMRDAPRPYRRISVGAMFDDAQARTAEFAADALKLQQTPRTVGMNPHDVFLVSL